MVMWTVGTTAQEAQVNPEHTQPDLEASLHSKIQRLYWLFLLSVGVLYGPFSGYSILKQKEGSNAGTGSQEAPGD